jgi:hypothetical protein
MAEKQKKKQKKKKMAGEQYTLEFTPEPVIFPIVPFILAVFFF